MIHNSCDQQTQHTSTQALVINAGQFFLQANKTPNFVVLKSHGKRDVGTMLEGCSGCIAGGPTSQSFTALQLHQDLQVVNFLESLVV